MKFFFYFLFFVLLLLLIMLVKRNIKDLEEILNGRDVMSLIGFQISNGKLEYRTGLPSGLQIMYV